MAQSTELESIVAFLDETLSISEFPDFSGAENGLQVEGPKRVARVAVAVDASEAVILDAVERGVQLLVVHHGLYWDGCRPLTGRSYRRVAPLVRNGVALYSAHLPLDAHGELGNCALLAEAIGLDWTARFVTFEGADIGVAGTMAGSREDLLGKVEEAVDGPARLIPGGPEEVGRVGVLTGGGASAVPEAGRAGLDTLVTGEVSHHSYLDAMEHGVNLILAGHYATETFGVRALGALLEERFGVSWEFLDHPTGL